MRLSLFIFGCLVLFTACQEQTAPATVHIELSEQVEGPVELVRPLQGLLIRMINIDTLTADEEGRYTARIDLTEPEHVWIAAGEQQYRLILLPGQSDTVRIGEDGVAFSGDHAAGQEFLNSWDRPSFTVTEARTYGPDTTAELVEQHIDRLRQPVLAQLNQLRDEEAISEAFYEVLRQDVDYYYALRTLQVGLNLRMRGPELSEDFAALVEGVIAQHPVEATPVPLDWYAYTNQIVEMQEMRRDLADGTVTMDSLRALHKDGEQHRYFVALAQDGLDGSWEERYLGWYLYLNALQDRHEKSLVDLFADYSAAYPGSPFIPYAAPYIEAITTYYEQIEQPLPEEANFWAREDYNSLDDLLQVYAGQPVYVDMWASWCKPCKEEFAYNEVVDPLLAERGVKRLYVSVDDDRQAEQWMESIRFYQLSGDHIRANEAFVNHFAEQYVPAGEPFAIPQYLLVDAQGQVVQSQAARPSNLEQLRRELARVVE